MTIILQLPSEWVGDPTLQAAIKGVLDSEYKYITLPQVNDADPNWQDTSTYRWFSSPFTVLRPGDIPEEPQGDDADFQGYYAELDEDWGDDGLFDLGRYAGEPFLPADTPVTIWGYWREDSSMGAGGYFGQVKGDEYMVFFC